MPALFDIAEVAFSRSGSYLAISHLSAEGERPAGVYVRSIRAVFQIGALFLVELIVDGRAVPFTEDPTPECLRLQAEGGIVEFAFDGADCLRISTRGVAVRLTCAEGAGLQAVPCGPRAWRVIASGRLCMVLPVEGELQIHAPWMGTGCSEVVITSAVDAEFALLDTAPEWDGWRPGRPFTDCVARVRVEFAAFLAAQLSCPAEFATAREKAAYLNWAALVNPSGLLKRTTMYMSKNWMSAVWSWDHCFNAIALAQGMPDLAWDQFISPFDHQSAQGALPDMLTDTNEILVHVKPPIHGWALRRMMTLNPKLLTPARARAAYDGLARMTTYWQEVRDPFNTGLPVYYHGNDSGWDNATTLLAGSPITAPDCAAFLVIQMEVLADLAECLGETTAVSWRTAADTLQSRLIAQLWRGTRFAMPSAADGREAPAGSDCLLPYMTLVLGERLPVEIRTALLDGLTAEGRFITPWGLATESPRSPYYKDNGYWRGPIWAPSTMLVLDGLQRLGETTLAMDLTRRFCLMCAREGFSENFDAETGQALCDRAYTWTASVFLTLAHDLR